MFHGVRGSLAGVSLKSPNMFLGILVPLLNMMKVYLRLLDVNYLMVNVYLL